MYLGNIKFNGISNNIMSNLNEATETKISKKVIIEECGKVEIENLKEGFHPDANYIITTVDGKTYEWKPSKEFYGQDFIEEVKEKFPEIKSNEDIETIKEKSIKESLSENSAKVVSSHIENMGGGTMAIFGELDDGTYFAGNEDAINIYSEDVWPIYASSEDIDIGKEVEKLEINEYSPDSIEFKEIMKQTDFFDEDELEEGVFDKIPGSNAQIAKAKEDSKAKGLYSEGELKEGTKEVEDRLASLRTQLEVDGAQLAEDEKEAIEKEIAELENKLDTDEVDNKIMNESAPGTDAYDKLVSGDDVFFRDESGVALLGHYADSYPEPEEYDEDFKIENGGTEEELQKAKEAANNRDVWEFLEVDESTCQPNGTIIAYIYGQDELMEYLKQLRQVEVTKKLEEDQIEDARKDSIEKGLVSEEEEPEPRKLTREEWNKEFGPGADPDVINAGREPQDRVEIIDESEDKSEITEEVKTSVEEAITKVLTDVYDKYGAKSGDITPEQSLKLEDLEEKISSLILELYNQNSDSIEESAKVLKENADDLAMLIEKTFGNSKLMYKFDGNFVSAEDFCYDFETTDFESSEELLNFLENYYNAENTWKLDDKKYEEIVNRIKAGEWELEESEETPIAEAQVKGLKEIKSQGNIHMLEDENKKIIVGENYNPSEGLIEKAEIYDNKEAADKDYLGRCEITKA